MAGQVSSFALPSGSDRIAHWALRNGFKWQALPDQAWFHAWEPYDTMVAPSRYLNAVSRGYRRGAITFVEPWLADEGFDPIDRTWLSFASHPRLIHKASVRVGESFLTRVAFVESPAPPRAEIGEPEWDEWATTFAVDRVQAERALRPALRSLLRYWRFEGHLEIRPGGLVVHVSGLGPTPENLDRLVQFIPAVIDAALDG